MKRLATIIACYLLTVSCFAVALWYMPNSWRMHPRLEKPSITIITKHQVPTDKTVCLIGDCAAVFAPWPVLKIAHGGAYSRHLVPGVKSRQLPPECNTFFIMSGVWLSLAKEYSPEEITNDNKEIEKAIKRKRPSAKIVIIPPSEIIELSEEYRRTEKPLYLPNDEGYAVLYKKFFLPATRM